MISGRSVSITRMRAYLPIILVGLAVFSAACIAYIAWDLTSEEPGPDPDADTESESDV